MALGICDILWIQQLLRDFNFGPNQKLFCDDQVAHNIAQNLNTIKRNILRLIGSSLRRSLKIKLLRYQQLGQRNS